MQIEVGLVTVEITYDSSDLSITGERDIVFNFIEELQDSNDNLMRTLDEQEKMRDKIRDLEYQLSEKEVPF